MVGAGCWHDGGWLLGRWGESPPHLMLQECNNGFVCLVFCKIILWERRLALS